MGMVRENDYRICDLMVCVMARLICDGDTIFHGVSSHMPMIAVLLAKQDRKSVV